MTVGSLSPRGVLLSCLPTHCPGMCQILLFQVLYSEDAALSRGSTELETLICQAVLQSLANRGMKISTDLI